MGSRKMKILDVLDENGWDVFSFDMLYNECGLSKAEIHGGLHYLMKSNTISTIEKGKYRRSKFTDEFVIACFMVPDGGIAYWSALNIHGLTEQFPNKIFIQSTRRGEEKRIDGIGATFHFINVKSKKLSGYKTFGYGNHQYQVTDKEKTFVDCFDLPNYSGGYNEIIKAFNRTELNSTKLIRYCECIDNKAVVKRIAYLTELLKKSNMRVFLSYANKTINENYSLFDGSLPKKGQYNPKWKLIINMKEEEIIEVANSLT